MIENNKIEEQLLGIHPRLCVGFAIRCSLRVLPTLVNKNKKPFWYWKEEDRGKHILAVLRIQQTGISFPAFGSDINVYKNSAYSDAKAAAIAADARADTDDSYTRKYAAAAHHSAIAYAKVVCANDCNKYRKDNNYESAAAKAATKYVIAAYNRAKKADISLKEEILKDLETIIGITETNSITEIIDSKATEFIYSKLWTFNKTKQWSDLYEHFNESLIALNEGFEIWVKWYRDRINGIHLIKEDEEEWLNLPVEVRDLNTKSINNYLNTEISKNPLNLVRAFFIGNRNTGKTSLIQRLIGKTHIVNKNKTSTDIEFSEWNIPESNIKARFCDFSGELISNFSYQLFFRKRCLYIVVLDAGSIKDIKQGKTSDEQAEYWLDKIITFNKNAQIMLVGNKSDSNSVKLSVNRLMKKYPNNILLKDNNDFHQISCTDTNGEYKCFFESFKNDLSNNLKNIGTHLIKFTNNEMTVLKQIRFITRNDNFLSHNDFDKLCYKHHIVNNGLGKEPFLQILDNLGELIYFKKLNWNDSYLLNPNWLTYGINTLLNSKKTMNQQGLINNIDVITILSNANSKNNNRSLYSKHKCRFIIDVMIEYELCYVFNKKTNIILIPFQLPKQNPILNRYFNHRNDDTFVQELQFINKYNTISLKFQFNEFIPLDIISKLIISRVDDIKIENTNYFIWKNSLLLHNADIESSAFIHADFNKHHLKLWINGNQIKNYLFILRAEIHKILNESETFTFSEYVYLPRHAIIHDNINVSKIEKTTFNRLIEESKSGYENTVSDTGTIYNLDKVLGFNMC